MKDFLIMSENSSDHWPFLKIENENVLDLGCGIWYTEEMEETSPVYFSKKAKLVVGVDSNGDDIGRYLEYCSNVDNIVFKHLGISNVNQVRELIHQYSITCLKSDIEGGEIVLGELTAEDLDGVKYIAIAFHTFELRDLFLKKFTEWGYTLELSASINCTPPNLGVLYGIKS